jgi:hypothetical protein
MGYITHIIALFAGVCLGFVLCALLASRTRARDLESLTDDEMMEAIGKEAYSGRRPD